MLDNNVAMNESAISFHTPKTKEKSKKQLLKGQPGPVKAKVYVTRIKQIVLAFFWLQGPNLHQPHAQGDHGEHELPLWIPGYRCPGQEDPEEEEASDNGQRLEVSLGQCPSSHCHCINGLDDSYTDQADWTPAIFAGPGASRFLLVSKGEERAGWPYSNQENVQEGARGNLQTIVAADFAEAFYQWYQLNEKCVLIGGSYVKKPRNTNCPNYLKKYIYSP
jgi:hypothetical protein